MGVLSLDDDRAILVTALVCSENISVYGLVYIITVATECNVAIRAFFVELYILEPLRLNCPLHPGKEPLMKITQHLLSSISQCLQPIGSFVC